MFTVRLVYRFTQVQSPIISLLAWDVCVFVGVGSGWRSRNVHLNEKHLSGFSLRSAASPYDLCSIYAVMQSVIPAVYFQLALLVNIPAPKI